MQTMDNGKLGILLVAAQADHARMLVTTPRPSDGDMRPGEYVRCQPRGLHSEIPQPRDERGGMHGAPILIHHANARSYDIPRNAHCAASATTHCTQLMRSCARSCAHPLAKLVHFFYTSDDVGRTLFLSELACCVGRRGEGWRTRKIKGAARDARESSVHAGSARHSLHNAACRPGVEALLLLGCACAGVNSRKRWPCAQGAGTLLKPANTSFNWFRICSR